MIFTRPIQQIPLPCNKAFAQEVQELYHELPADTREVLIGIAGSSPYLHGLLLRHADWLTATMHETPETVFQTLLDETRADLPDNSEQTLMNHLRRQKARVALALALCDLSGILPLEDITKTLTQFADCVVDVACRFEIIRAQTARDLPKDRQTLNGYCVIAMGKMGAFELNYSSDIDLIFLFDDTGLTDAERIDHAQIFRKITNTVLRILSEQTPTGYVFRTDIRLRPNPSATQVCVPISKAAAYYQNDGRSWERAAFIKARACAGDIKGGQKFLKSLQGFIWRSQVDFDARGDINAMMQATHHHKRQTRAALDAGRLDGYNMKVGYGGIRTIEMIAQSRQLVYGGRDADLRESQTLNALEVLADKGWIEREYAERLATSYRHHRMVEHRIQMLRDAQGHSLPNNDEGFMQISNLCGYPDPAPFKAAVLHHLHNVAEVPPTSAIVANPPLDTGVDGASLAPDNQARMTAWLDYSCLQTQKARDSFNEFRKVIVQEATDSKDETAIISGFETFLRHLNKSVQIFALFANRPDILKKVLSLCAMSDGLALHLSQHQDVLDGLVESGTSPITHTRADYEKIIAKLITDADDFELSATQLRKWHKEELFRIIMETLGDTALLAQNRHAFSYLAEACIQTALSLCKREMTRRYGLMDGMGISILVMGRLATRDMNAGSDLDMITVYSGGDGADGYYAKLTRLLITFLSAQMAHGRLYDVDMRLRPSGRAGPVASSLAAFKDYHETQAWVWEHLALCRMKPLGGLGELHRAIEDIRRDIIASPRDMAEVKLRIKEMLARLREQHQAGANALSVKKCAGGLLEISLLGQALVLLGDGGLQIATSDQLRQGAAGGLITTAEADDLCTTHAFLERIEQVQHLFLTVPFAVDKLSAPACDFLLRAMGCESVAELQEDLSARCSRAQGVIDGFFSC